MSCPTTILLDRYQSQLPPSQLSVLLFVARRLSAVSPVVRFSHIEIQAGTGLSCSTVITCLRVLETLGALIIDRISNAHSYSIPVLAFNGPAQNQQPSPVSPGVPVQNLNNVQNLYIPDQIRLDKTDKKRRSDQIAPSLFESAPPPDSESIETTVIAPPQQMTMRDAERVSLSNILPLFKSIRTERPADLENQLLDISHAFGGNGFQATAALEKALKYIRTHPEKRPESWGYCITVVRNFFVIQTTADKEEDRAFRREAAERKDRITQIDTTERELPFVPAPGDTYDPQFRESVLSKLSVLKRTRLR